MDTVNRQAGFLEPRALKPGADYYRQRAEDYLARHARSTDQPRRPPAYYLDYGDKYAQRFTQVLRPAMSAVGQQWIDATFRRLQVLLERRRAADPWRFAELEEDTRAFQGLAYSMHAQAYIECGIAKLPRLDLVRIARTPDIRDLLTQAGLEQVLSVLAHVVKARWQNFVLSWVVRDMLQRQEKI
ncbi:hypothetical protein TFLX_01675 [Thermoflexales bacterium]|nr:hypothetical protein TFLX_01675 [Thermoflexales bacterium]